MGKLDKKVIVITGSTRGIGQAIAQACAQEGASVVICSRNKIAVKQTVKDFKENGFSVSGLDVDVSKQDDLEKLLSHALDTWDKVDVWINNAGLSGGYRLLEDISEEEIQALVGVNMTGLLLACRMIIPYFRQNKGILINLSGKGGRGDPSPYTTVYAATKAAVSSLTKSLAQENKAYPLSIHAVLPGMVATDLYKDIKTRTDLENDIQNIPLILKAIGVSKEEVGLLFVKIAAQEPGKVTGKIYSLFKGWRLIKGIFLMSWYRLTGKIKT